MARNNARRNREEGGGWKFQSFLILGVLAMMAWGGNELVGIKESIYGMQAKQVGYDETHDMATRMHDAILRMEINQKKGLKDIKILREEESD